MKVQFTCLANSRRESGRCIAGIRNDGGEWFRPISTSGPLMRRDYLLEDGNIPEILDTIQVEVVESKPESYQPENWILGAKTWKLIGKVNPINAYELFKNFITCGPELFGNIADRVSLSVIKDNPLQSSLALIEPKDLSWFITENIRGKRQSRARFRLGRTGYDLPITDPIWETRLRILDLGTYPRKAADVGADVTIFFTISLGGPFGGECYKLIAGILEIPRESIDLIDLLVRRNIEFKDMRRVGGAFWLIGGKELIPSITELNAKGILFKYLPKGGRASGHRPAWYYKT